MPQFTITVNRPEVSVSTTQTGPSVTINETPVSITQNTSTIAVTSAPQVVIVNTAATTIQTTTLDEAFKGEWGGSVTYHRGDLVRYEQSVYVYIDTTPRTTAAPDVDTDYWVLLFSETGLTGPQVIGLNRAINLNTWDSETEYSIGDIVFLRQDYDIDVGVTVPYYTMYRLYHISGSIGVNPFTHSAPPSIVDDVVTFDENSAWQNLSGVRSINGFSGDVSLQEILDASSLSLNTSSFVQGSNENHGSFESHADSVYLYGDALYIGQNTSTADVGFLLSNQGGSALVVIDAATGKLKFSNDLTNYYNLPTSTDDLAEGSTNKYYNNTLVADYLANNIITASEIRAVTGGYMVITDNAENNYFYVDDNSSQVGAGTHTWQFNNDGSTSFPTFSLPATDGTSNQVLTTNGSGLVTFATPSTTDITEGTNKYYTDTRFDDRLATKTSDNLSEGSTNKYFTNTRFDDRLATKSTTNLAEGSNLYYTTSRANSDFDTRLATKSTTNLAEGTNLYYTTSRANSDFDTRLATKSTTNLAEGTNQYFTNTRARGALSGSTGISYNNTTGAISIDDTVVATHAYVGTQISNLVDSSPSTLDTLNELAAALGDDPNFATTVSTNLGNKLNTSDFTSTANTWLGTKSTTNLTEGSNLYYTDARARGAVSVGYTGISAGLTYNSSTGVLTYIAPGTDDVPEGIANKYYTDARARGAISASGSLSYNSSTGVVSYSTPTTDGITEGSTNLYFTNARARAAVDNNVDLDVDGSNNVYVKSIRDATRVKGNLEVTPNDSYVFPLAPLTTVAGTNGIDIASSSGNNPAVNLRHYTSDTSAGSNTSAALAFSQANGTNSAPSATQTNLVLGSINYNGYGTTDFVNRTATINQGSGTTSISAIQMQAYARQAFADASVSTTVIGASGTGSVATLTFATQNLPPYFVGQTVTIAGMTPSGYNGTVVITAASVSSISYANATTGFTTGGTITARTVTQGGAGMRIRGYPNSTNVTPITRVTMMDMTTSATTFKSDAYTFADSAITGALLTSRNYMTLGATVGSINQDTFTVKNTAGTSTYASFVSTGTTLTGAGLHQITRTTVGTPGVSENRPSFNIQLTRSDQAAPSNNDGTGFRYRVAGSNGTNYTIADMSANYNTGGDTVWGLFLANGDQTGATFSGLNTFQSKISQTTISAGTASGTAGGSSVSTVATFAPSQTTLTASGTTYANFSSTSAQISNSGRTTISRSTPGTGLLLTQQTANANPADAESTDFRLGVAGTVTSSNFARIDGTYRSSGDNEIGLSVSTDSFTADTDRIYIGARAKTQIRATPAGGGTASDILTVETTKITAAAPIAFPIYSRSAAGALTGSTGWQICISDSSGSGGGRPNGMMAFWDTSNSRWSYIHDNSAL